MKKISRLLLAGLVASSLTACAVTTARVVRSDGSSTTASATDSKETGGLAGGSGSTMAEKPDDLKKTDAAPSETKADPGTQTDLTTTAEATQTDPETKPETAASETKPKETKPAETKPSETKPAESTTADAERDIKSNLSPEFQQILDQPENGILIIYRPDLYTEIKAITKWDVTEYNTNTQIFLVAKDKGSRIELTVSKLVDDDRVVIPGDVIRDWDTTSDFEVIRIVYTDPETLPFNFIRVREPSGRVTTTPIHTSMRGNPEDEAIFYDEED